MGVITMLLVIFFLGSMALRWLTVRTTHDRQLVRWLLVSYCLRVLLAVVLFNISYWHWPVFQSLQIPGGFWTFGIDSQAYHNYGRAMAMAWREGTTVAWPEPRQFLFSFIVAVIYRIFGVHLLYPLMFNALCGAACGLVAYHIAGRCMGERARLPAALLIAFWPSSILWSAQLLKDPLSWCAMLTALYLTIVWCQDSRTSEARRTRWRVLSWLGLMLAVTVMTKLRFYVGFTLLAATSLVVGAAMLSAAFRGRFGQEIHLVGLVLTITLATSFSHSAFSQDGLQVDRQPHQITAPQPPIVTPPHQITAPQPPIVTPPHQITAPQPPIVTPPHQITTARPRVLVVSQHVRAVPPDKDPPHRALLYSMVTVIFRELRAFLSVASVENLIRTRQGFMSTGGHSLVDDQAETPSLGALWWHLPKGLIIALLAPFPNQWFDTSGSTGVMRVYSAVEMLLLYGLLLLSVASARTHTVFQRRDRGGLLLVTFTILLLSGMALTVINVGTLFRLRLLFLFPLLILISGAAQDVGVGCFERR